MNDETAQQQLQTSMRGNEKRDWSLQELESKNGLVSQRFKLFRGQQ